MRMESGWGLSAQRESPNPRGSGSAVHGVVAAAEADVVSTPCSPGLGSVGSSADQADVAGDDGAGAARGGAAAGRWNSSPSPSGSLGDLSLSSTEWETPSHSFRGPDAESESSHGYSKDTGGSTVQAVRSLLQGLSGAPWEMEGMQWLIERTMDGCYPPEIVVLSGNSSEKGALLSRLTMLPVFPPQNELCDQMPIHLCLRHSREAQPCSMELQDLKTGSILKGPWEFPAGTGFQDMQSKIAELSAAEEPRFPVIFTDRAMILHVSSPYVPNLDLVDLPGLEQSSPELAMAGEELVAHYIQSRGPRSIFLAVVTASSNPTASRVMALLQRHGLQERSIGVLTMCDELPRHKHDALRSRLSDPQDRQAWPSRSSQGNDGDLWLRHGYVAIEIGPLEARDTIATPGTRYAGLYQQAIREFQWFEGSDFRDLARSGKASCNALVDRICDAVWLCMADSWAPVALFHLNHEIQHLQYRMALLGPPTASAKGLQQSRRHAGEVAAGRLVDAEIRLMDLYCDQMLMGLEQAVLELVPSELVVLPWELGDRWFGLKEQVMEVCSKSLRAATTFWVRELRSELLRGGGIPPWPSPEALDMISLELPAMSPVVWRARHLLESWLQEITEKEHSLAMADIQACLDLFFDRAQRHPGVRISPLLGASPKAVRLEADSRALADSLVVVFLASASDLVRHRVAGALPGMVEAASSSSEPAEIRADMEEQALRLRKSVVMVEELLQHGGESVLSEELRKVSVCRCTVEAEEIASFGGVRVIVTARDSLGGLLCGGDLPFRIRWQVEASRVVVANLKYIGRGLYAADFDPSAVSRLLTGTVIHVELYGTELPGSPFVMDFLATQWIQCSGSGLEFAMPGRAQHFTICARDGGNGGELRLHGGLKFSVLSQKRSRIPVRIEYSQSEGTYGVTYEVPPPSKAQPYALSLNVELKGGTAVLGSPFLVPFILPSIQVDFPLQHLSGCRLHYDEPYSAAASELDFPSAADGCWVFVCEVNTASNPGCAAIGAFGKLGEVFVDRATHSGSSLYEHNGLFWYWRPGKAFGFASSQDADLAAPQIAPHSLPPRRDQLSWALSSWSGGDRARDNALVSDSLSSWRKRIYLIGKKKRSPRQRVTSISVLPSICE